MVIAIRKAGAGDIDVLDSFLSGLFAIEDDFTACSERHKRALAMIIGGQTGSVIFMAEADGRPAGMVNLQKIISTASGGYSVILEDLYVTEKHRGMGIGKKLLDTAVAWAREQHALRIQLAADYRNKKAGDFYSMNGFRVSHMLCHYRML